MRYRPFGKTSLSVSEVGFGCARIGGVFQGSGRRQVLDLLRHALDSGITLFDTADMYTQGESERLLGEAFRHDRARVVIATKFGYQLPAQKRIVSHIKPLLRPVVARLGLASRHLHPTLRGAVSQQDFTPAYITQAVEGSLRRLRTDYLDIYQLHSPPLDVLRRGGFVEQLEKLRDQGKIRYWGVACEQPDSVAECLQYESLASIQVGLSVLEQAALDAAIPAAAKRGIAIIGRQVYASGLLTRPIHSIDQRHLDNDPFVARQKSEQITRFASIAERSGRVRDEMALKFALSTEELASVLLGISRQDQLDASLRALEAPRLTPDERQLLLAVRRSGR